MNRAGRPSALPRVFACAVGAIFVAVLATGVDHRFADWLFALQGGSWRLRRDPLFASLLHGQVQRLCLLWYGLVLVAALVCRALPGQAALARVLGYVALANTLCIVVVTLGKALLPIPCPWDLARYGGRLPAGGLLDWQSGAKVKGCFPSGHAVGGYAQFAWYYAARAWRPRLAPWAFLAALAAGLGLGLVQQARGAHFASHDLACALLCWLLAWALARRLLAPAPAAASNAGHAPTTVGATG